MEVSLFNRDFHARGIIRTSCVYIKWRGEDRDGQIDEEKRTKRKGARRGGRVKGSSRKYIRERLKGRTSESRGWPRTRWMPLSTRTRWKGCGRTAKGRRRRCIDALGAAGGPMGDHAGPSPPVGVRAEWWQGGAKPVGGGVARPTPRRGLDRRGARCAQRVFQRSCGKREQRDRARCAPLVQGIYRAKMYAFLRIRSFPSFLLVSFRLLFFFWEFVLEELF